MSRKPLLVLALVVVWLGFTGQARATYQTDLELALTYIQDAYVESFGELSTETDDTYALYAIYFEAVAQAYLTLALQTASSASQTYISAAYQYAYWAVVYSWASFANIGLFRDNFSSLSAYNYAILAYVYAYSAYLTFP